MEQLRIHSRDCILVCDGSKAILLRNDGDAHEFDFVEIRTSRNEGVPSRAMGRDRPGRVHPPSGNLRSSVEASDLHDRAEQRFLASIAEEITHDIETQVVQRLVIIAPPRALAVIRPLLSMRAEAAVIGEIAKDFTKISVPEIENRLRALDV